MDHVVLDTNVVISAAISRSYPYFIMIDCLVKGTATIHLSREILEEYLEVKNRLKFERYGNFQRDMDAILESLEEIGVMTSPTLTLDVCKDQDDNKFLELAVSAHADYLITGNLKHFPIDKFSGVKIISPKNYWNLINNPSET